MTSYNNIFGGPNVQPATISYAAYGTIAVPQNVNLQLNWATSYVDNNTPVAQIMDFYTTLNGIVMTFPDATQNSVGQVCQINNQSAHTLTVNKFDGTLLVSIVTGTSVQIYLTNNTTSAGLWNTIQSGAVNSAPNAAALAGSGLIALGNTLNTNIPSTILNGNYVATVADRSKLFVWQGGAGTITLPVYSTLYPALPPVPNGGWDIAFNNSGTGALTITTPDSSQFDGTGSTSFILNPGQSSNFIASGASIAGPTYLWNSLGYGQETFFSFNALTLDIAAGGTFTLTAQQSSRQIINLDGNLFQAAVIQFPIAPGAWYVNNLTNGAHTVTLQLVGGVSPFIIPPGARYIVYCDGTNLYNTPTAVTSVAFPDGSVGSPSIGFGSDPTSGFYKSAAGQMSYSSQATQILAFTQNGLDLYSQNGALFWNSGNTYFTSLQSGATGNDIVLLLPTNDPTVNNQLMYGTTAGQLNFTTATFPLTTVANQILYSSATNTVAGLATANNGTLITSAGGVPSISSTLPTAVQGNITTLGTITSGVWNGTPITVANGGTGLTTLTTAYGVVCAGTTATGALQNAGTGTAGQILTSAGAASLPTWTNAPPVNVFVGYAASVNVAGANTSLTIPQDNTVPQSNEGLQFMTLSYTPTNALNKLMIEFVSSASTTNVSGGMVVALFQDANVNALSSVSVWPPSSQANPLILRWYMTAGTTASTTFKIRFGSRNGNLVYIGTDNPATLGGTIASTFNIYELKT